ncbi:lectin C-type domain protein [Leptospira broomii serovar Hurstbridge str. 5399]|uniref:Lectin C-type domain protein n=1 Tax=Leptospira broomii serovar Hurstbridge str. 5399 TaxID=1049789 RepID=T0FBC4_9LEPT|nr:lectin-like protein [Leptospira broomii]EQA45166.1 lectin C-type domain protein [Leptospira broomii serovar Hurstbridge str. 5399]
MKRISIFLVLSVFLTAGNSLFASRGAVVPNPIDLFEKSAEAKAISIQRQIQIETNLPAHKALFYGTHNSYNSKAYAGPFFSYSFPNQQYSIGDQLRLGARFIELDIHYVLGAHFAKDFLLCHAQANGVGCNVFDRPVGNGLAEIQNWISQPQNRNEVLVLYFEDYLDNRADQFLGIVRSYLDPYLHQYSSGSCGEIPSPDNMPKLKDLVASNRRILLMSNGCYSGAWNSYFKRIFFGDYTIHPKDFRGYPDCNWSRSTYDSSMTRVYNDSTNYFGIFDGAKETGTFTNANIPQMLSCGISVFGIDQFNPDFAKLGLWSWGVGEPNNYNNNEHCGQIRSDGRWNDNNCSAGFRYACKDGSGNWTITDDSGVWNNGRNACSSRGWQFSAPLTPYENIKLQETKNSKGVSDVWVDLTDQYREGYWERGR